MLVEHIRSGMRYEAEQETRRVAQYESFVWRVNGQVMSQANFWKQYRLVAEMEPTQ